MENEQKPAHLRKILITTISGVLFTTLLVIAGLFLSPSFPLQGGRLYTKTESNVLGVATENHPFWETIISALFPHPKENSSGQTVITTTTKTITGSSNTASGQTTTSTEDASILTKINETNEALMELDDKLISFVSSPTPITAINLLRNSSFEAQSGNQPNSWQYLGQSTLANTFTNNATARTGNLALRIQPQNGATNFGVYQPSVTTSPNHTYTFSVYVYNQSSGNFNLTLSFWDTLEKRRIMTNSFTVATIGGWQRFENTIEPGNTPDYLPDHTYFPMIEVMNVPSGNVYLDDAELSETSTAPIFTRENLFLGDGSLNADANGNLYPAFSRVGSLGTDTSRFNTLYLTGASIDGDGNTSISGTLSVSGKTTFNNLQIAGNTTLDQNLTLSQITVPAITTDKLYNVGGALIWVGNTLLTTANYAPTLDPVYVNVAESPATGNVSGSFQNGLTVSGLTVSSFSSPNISQWTNDATYITPSSANALTNKSGNISMWNNDSSYISASSTLTGLVQSTTSGNSYFTGGNVGIGTTNPISKLDVAGNIAGTTFNGVGFTGTAGKTLTINNSLTLAGTDGTTMTMPGSSTTLAGLGISQTFSGVNTFSGNLIFGGATGILGSNGNVGIGTTAPNYNLEVDKNSADNNPGLYIFNANGDSSRKSGLRMGSDTYQNFYADISYFRGTDYNANNQAIIFNLTGQNGFSGSGSNEIMRMTTKGTVGIGNTNPIFPLSVGESNVFSYASDEWAKVDIGVIESGGLGRTGSRVQYLVNSSTAPNFPIGYTMRGDVTATNASLHGYFTDLQLKSAGSEVIGFEAENSNRTGSSPVWPPNTAFGQTNVIGYIASIMNGATADSTIAYGIFNNTGGSYMYRGGLYIDTNSIRDNALWIRTQGNADKAIRVDDLGSGYANVTNFLSADQNGVFKKGNIYQNGANVGIGTTSPGYTLTVNGTSWTTNNAWAGSDARWKQNVAPIGNALDKIMALQGVSYTWDQADYPQNNFDDKTHLGFIAQQVESVLPELVTTGTDGYKGVDYNGFAPLLVNAIQQQQGEINNMIAAQTSTSATLAGVKIDSTGNVGIGNLKVDKLLIGSSDASTSTLTSDGTSIIFTDKNNTMAQILTTSSQAYYDPTGKIASIEDRVAALESVIASGVKQSSPSAQIASSPLQDLRPATPRNDTSETLALTPPDILLATGSATMVNLTVTSEATISGKLTAYSAAISETFKSFGQTLLGSTIISGDFSQDGTLSITEGSKINAIPVLYLQDTPLAENINIFNGQVVIDKNGNITTQSITATEYRGVNGKSVGSNKITAGTDFVEISNELVKNNSRIFVVPTIKTSAILSVTSKIEGDKFVISASSNPTQDLTFDWWIINE